MGRGLSIEDISDVLRVVDSYYVSTLGDILGLNMEEECRGLKEMGIDVEAAQTKLEERHFEELRIILSQGKEKT